MNATLSNEHILNLEHHLQQYLPKDVSMATFRRLSRNTRKIQSAANEYRHEFNRLRNSCVIDKSKRPDNGQESVVLTVAEAEAFQPKLRELLKATQDVEIHTIELYDSKAGEVAADTSHAIDVQVARPSVAAMSVMDGVVFVPAGQVSK